MENQLAEAQRENAWLRAELERQRALNIEMRRAVADLARTFQETLAVAYEAGESGDIAQVRALTRQNRANWQEYLQKIINAAQRQSSESKP
jgi:hypothetical protein